jgi:hypothetical protein
LIQGERRTSNIDSKIHLLGFYYFKIQFHSFILDTFSTASVKRGHQTTIGLGPVSFRERAFHNLSLRERATMTR